MPSSCTRCSAVTATSSLCTGCMLATWGLDEGSYAANGYAGAGRPGELRETPGAGNVIVTAPHAVNYWRGNAPCRAAMYTGSLAHTLAQAWGVRALSASGGAATPGDPSAPDPAFTTKLASLAGPGVLVVDLLGMLDRTADVCLGTGPNPDPTSRRAAELLAKMLEARGLKVTINDPFPARAPWCVTAYAQQRLLASAIQVEAAAWLRRPNDNPQAAQLLLHALGAVVSAFLT